MIAARALGRLGPCTSCRRPIFHNQRIWADTTHPVYRRFAHSQIDDCLAMRRGPSEPMSVGSIVSEIVGRMR